MPHHLSCNPPPHITQSSLSELPPSNYHSLSLLSRRFWHIFYAFSYILLFFLHIKLISLVIALIVPPPSPRLTQLSLSKPYPPPSLSDMIFEPSLVSTHLWFKRRRRRIATAITECLFKYGISIYYELITVLWIQCLCSKCEFNVAKF